MNTMTANQILLFLQQVDRFFPVRLSAKTDLKLLSHKFEEKATVCTVEEHGQFQAMVAGYTDNVVDNVGYISVVATLPKAQGKGYASKLLREFIGIARGKGLDAVHLYTVPSNKAAVLMYKKLGFVEYLVPNESRPEDLHLIYHIGKKKNI